MKVLVPDAYAGPLPTLQGVSFVVIPAAQPVPEEHVDAEVLVAWGQPLSVLQDAATKMTRLRLVQGLAAGPDLLFAAGFAPEVLLSSGVGLHNGPVTEHALALLLALIRQLPLAIERQHEHVWDARLAGAMTPRADDGRITSLQGAKIAVWGFGAIASTLAPVLASLGAEVTGVARSAGERHGFPVVSDDSLPELLPSTDVLIMILPRTESTNHALNAERLAQLKPGALLINVGRGTTVDGEAVIKALESGRLAGAALDVTEVEPLPESSPLWDAPRLLITPHVASGRPQHADALLAENISALIDGKPLRNLLGR